VSGDKVRWHLIIDRDVQEGIWEIVKKRYVNPYKKLHIVVNEALREYIAKHREEA